MTDDQANVSREPSTRESFRDRKARELSQELGTEPSQPAESEDTSPELEPEEATSERETEDELLEESDEDQPESDEEAEAVYDEDDVPDIVELRSQLETLTSERDQAVEAKKSFEKDYRRKTHKLGEQTRQADADREQLASVAQFQTQQAEAELQQFNQVNWQNLQVNDPAQFQQLQQQYQAAVNKAQNYKAQQEHMLGLFNQQKQAETNYRAEVSREILTREIPGWGADLYKEVCTFAQNEYDISEKEFAELDDWRPVRAIYDAYKSRQVKTKSKDVVKKLGRKRGKPPAGKTAPDGQPRNASGQFTKARAEAHANPGNRSRFREMKAAQLNAERKRR